MKISTKNFKIEVGKKLYLVRKENELTRNEMAVNLGLARGNYYKNEIGYSLPCLDTIYRLYKDFDVSVDWLLFDSPPMHNKEKLSASISLEKGGGLQEKQPAVIELLDAMEKDPMLLHEIMLYYYKYQKAVSPTYPSNDRHFLSKAFNE